MGHCLSPSSVTSSLSLPQDPQSRTLWVYSHLCRALRRKGVNADVADELALTRLEPILAALASSKVAPGLEAHYVIRCATRLFYSLARHEVRDRARTTDTDPDSVASPVEDPESALLRTEIRRRVHQGLATITADERSMLERVYFDEEPVARLVADEIERATRSADGRPFETIRNAVYKRLERARTRLREAIPESG